MTVVETSKIEFKIATNGSTIVEIDDVLLHSKYNPEKEAETYIRNFDKEISENKNILILGLGCGYHVLETIKLAHKHHDNKFNIVVIEPNFTLTKAVLNKQILQDAKISIFSDRNVQQLYKNKNLIHFLTQKPILINWTPSFNLNRDFFTDFLSYKTSYKIEDVLDLITDARMKTYLQTLPASTTFNTPINIDSKDQSEEAIIIKIYNELLIQKLKNGAYNAKRYSDYSN